MTEPGTLWVVNRAYNNTDVNELLLLLTQLGSLIR